MKPSTLFPTEPAANPQAMAKVGGYRITVLSSQLLRCEFSLDAHFEDRATLSVLNRRTPLVEFDMKLVDSGFVLKTSDVTLTCTDANVAPTAETMFAEFTLDTAGKRRGRWRYGDVPSANLGGTARTLDGCDGGWHCAWKNNQIVRELGKPLEIEPGLLSRDGWALVDDSRTVLLDRANKAESLWCTPRPERGALDFYLLLHGRNYAKALEDAALIFGRQALPPRYAFGYWFCRYWAYTDRDLEELVEHHNRAHLPLDVVVIDMDWHQLGWTGYTWSKEFFPDHRETLRHLKDHQLKISLNLHPADGVAKNEERYLEFRKAMGEANAKKAETKDGRIPFDSTDPNYMRAYFSVLHHPLEQEGVDVWWMDWQQGQSSKIKNLDPLPWINFLHYRDQAEQAPNKRPLVFTRYGGLGSGRQPIGFSGDTTSTWESLAYQPGFTAKSANVLFGHWSHDVGGHFSKPEPELYVRWLQWGAYSPILRTHSTKNPDNDRRVYALPDPFRYVAEDAIRRRYELVPYIATEWRKLLTTGQSLLRPMYHQHPETDDAYRCEHQYYFGSEMIVAPVVTPRQGDVEEAPYRVWVPEGSFIETATGQTLKAGWNELSALIDEVPVLVRKGAVIPGLFGARRLLSGSYQHLLLDVWAGGNGSYTLVEDDGETLGYARGEEVQIHIEHREEVGGRTLTISKAAGAFKGFKPTRPLRIRIHQAAPPSSVEVGKQKLPLSHRSRADHFSYDGDTATTIIDLASLDLRQETRIALREYPLAKGALEGLPGLLRRLKRAMQKTLEISYYLPVHAEERLCALLAQTGNRISRRPETIAAELERLHQSLPRLEQVLKEHQDALATHQDAPARPKANEVFRARRIVESAVKGLLPAGYSLSTVRTPRRARSTSVARRKRS
ncbi:MAG: glycoside hydrolase family 31 protein [Polyangiaceae bacterium]|nr:glycoside hydrolase family 31 protein [Polyangiaceae bacterium]